MGRKKLGREIVIPIYGRLLNIIVTDDIQEALRSIDFHDFNESETLEGTVLTDDNGLMNLIIKPDADMNTICHESFHVMYNVLSDAGMKLCDKSEEGFAYLIGWVAGEVEKELKRKKRLFG